MLTAGTAETHEKSLRALRARRLNVAFSASRFRRSAPSAVTLAGLALICHAGLRIYRDYPAVDRSADRRPAAVLSALTEGIDDRHTILLTDLNWQVQNGLSYYAKNERPEIAYARLADVLLYAPALVRDNFDIGRDVALTARARDGLVAAYGPLIPTVADDPCGITRNFRPERRASPRHVVRMLAVLKPSREFTVRCRRIPSRAVGGFERRPAHVHARWRLRGAGRSHRRTARAGDRLGQPFRRRLNLGGVPVEVRMESWLAADTIRRMGFGRCDRGPAPHADRRTRRQLRGVRPVRPANSIGIRRQHLRAAVEISLLSLNS